MGPLANAFLAARREQQPCASTGSSHGYQGNRILKALSEQAEKEAVEEEKSDGESPLPKTPLDNETHEVIDDFILPCLYVLGRIEVERSVGAVSTDIPCVGSALAVFACRVSVSLLQ